VRFLVKSVDLNSLSQLGYCDTIGRPPTLRVASNRELVSSNFSGTGSRENAKTLTSSNACMRSGR
jgi:hypothetical protein